MTATDAMAARAYLAAMVAGDVSPSQIVGMEDCSTNSRTLLADLGRVPRALELELGDSQTRGQ